MFAENDLRSAGRGGGCATSCVAPDVPARSASAASEIAVRRKDPMLGP